MNRALAILMLSLPLLGCTGAITGDIPSDPSSGLTGAAGSQGTGISTGVAGTGTSTGAAGMGTSTGAAGTGTSTGAAGTGTSTGAAGAAGSGPGGIPADVAAMIGTRCIACHGSPPIQGVPSSLATYASLTGPSKTDSTKSVAVLALERMQNKAMPMPPAGLLPATAAEIAAFQSWVSAGTPPSVCPDGGVPLDSGVIADPYSTPITCTSKTMWTRGTSGSGSMEPGMACITCHALGRGPGFAIGGTVYPTAHEPDSCNGGSAATMAQIVITGADGKIITLTPNSAGNFSYGGALAKPYKAKVTSMGRERAMIATQTSGDCNSCHTVSGAMMAPGRVMLP